eukprot:COSAG05_NODE_13516_length_427_cov_0.768293_1_plen_63_part_10
MIFQLKTQRYGAIQIDAGSSFDAVSGSSMKFVSPELHMSASEKLNVWAGAAADVNSVDMRVGV